MSTTADQLRQQAADLRRAADEIDLVSADKDGMKKIMAPVILTFLQTRTSTTKATDDLIDAIAAHERAGAELIAALKGIIP